ncbi:MAG: Aspartokinase [uncultured Pseudonocardia sp.]|uniref:Aspartokinase n=1 Tax=uncultured Pseudonocardia sp. TaxID=211455 RepID=A0A6J4QF11_9PSEU|nr:MAG: Aspartokinase [uncultured Pseudonocardia sp.]
MEIVVHKYGGSSLATVSQVRAVAERVAVASATGRPVVVVVSARGRTTNSLLELASTFGRGSQDRETDQLVATAEAASAAQLAMALETLGRRAVSLTGAQAGIRVRGPHGEGRISDIAPGRLFEFLGRNVTPVVAGFQGTNEDGDVTTLGRGGSDTTAVALAAALDARRCEIYTDVDGVFSADPRVVGAARILASVDYRAMAEMAKSGARVLHPRSVALAFTHDVEVHVRHGARPGRGSVLTRRGMSSVEPSGGVIAVTHDAAVAEICLTVEVADQHSLPDALDRVAEIGVDIDLLSRVDSAGKIRLRFTIPRVHVEDAAAALRQIGLTPEINETLGKVSLIDCSLVASPARPAGALRALNEAGITGISVHTAQMRTSVLVPLDQLLDSVAALHTAFGLDSRSAVPL